MRKLWRPSAVALTTLALTVPLFAAVAPVAAPTASADPVPTSIRINEVESDGGTPGDWIEFTNIGSSAVDVSGWIVKDNDDSRTDALPAGTTIQPGGFYVYGEPAEKDGPGMSFGLGKEDSARLYLADGSTLVDSYSWSAHAATSYGRCTDGTGDFATTVSPTKGAANDCEQDPGAVVRINEIESSGGTPVDWVELTNIGTTDVDASGLVIRDNKDSDAVTVPSGSVIAAGGFLAVDVDIDGGFGLGGADSARLFDADGTTLIDSYEWTEHASTTYGRCPDGTGAFETTASSTKGAANDCAAPAATVVINEVDASGEPKDWIELKNVTSAAIDLSGLVLKDDSSKQFTIPTGTSIAAGGYATFDVADAFGLGKGGDSARLFQADGSTLIDSFTWTADSAPGTWGRCPDGTGAFAVNGTKTKGAANNCDPTGPTDPTDPTDPGIPGAVTWPGGADVTPAAVKDYFGTNMSGLNYELGENGAPDTLWAVKNGPGTLYRLQKSGTDWVPAGTDGWGSGKLLHYTDGTGDVDAEGVVRTADGMFVSSERNNAKNSVSRPAVLRYDTSATGTELTASMEWNLTADLPVVGPNLGLEGVAFVPDSALVSKGFVDEKTGSAYDPADYANHGGGLFFVGLEGTGGIYAYALDQTDGTKFTRVATIASGFPAVMELQYDPERSALWAVCDNTCGVQFALLDVAQSGANAGHFAVTSLFDKPAGLDGSFNIEGFTPAPQALCVNGVKPAMWSDDDQNGGYALRQGTIDCTEATVPTQPTDPSTPAAPTPVDQSQPTDATGGSASAAVTGPSSLASTGATPIGAVVAALFFLLAGAAVVILRRPRRA